MVTGFQFQRATGANSAAMTPRDAIAATAWLSSVPEDTIDRLADQSALHRVPSGSSPTRSRLPSSALRRLWRLSGPFSSPRASGRPSPPLRGRIRALQLPGVLYKLHRHHLMVLHKARRIAVRRRAWRHESARIGVGWREVKWVSSQTCPHGQSLKLAHGAKEISVETRNNRPDRRWRGSPPDATSGFDTHDAGAS
jgi:hypothetical protein